MGNFKKKIVILLLFLITITLISSFTAVSAAQVSNQTVDETADNDILEISQSDEIISSTVSSENLSSSYLVLDNDADKEDIVVGEEVTWIITASNLGQDTAKNTKVFNKLPQGLKYIKHSTTKGTFNPKTGIWNIGNLSIDDGIVELWITTLALTNGKMINKAYIVTDSENSNINESYEEEEIDVFEPEKKVSKDVEIVSPKMHATGNPLFLILISIFMLLPIFKR